MGKVPAQHRATYSGRTSHWKFFQSLCFFKNLLNQIACCVAVVQCDVLGKSIKFLQGWFRPDYFSHLSIFSLASFWLYV